MDDVQVGHRAVEPLRPVVAAGWDVPAERTELLVAYGPFAGM